jgi:alpha-1,2-mannosyltransferase
VAQVAHPRPLAGALVALRRTSELGLLAVAPALLALAVIGGAIGNRYAFDFHGALWGAARDVLDGRNPYPPPTTAGVAPGDRFVYPPPVALLLVPLGALPFPLAAGIITAVLIAAVAATLAVLGVRDWRCYGAAYLSIAVLHDIRLGALTPLLALGLALVWRWRAQARAAVPLALIVVAKLFLWPLGVWLVATGRVRVALRAAVLAVAASALGWAVIGFAGLADYPQLLRVLADAEQERGYSLVAAGAALGLGPEAARAAAVAVGVALLAFCWREGRRGFDERSLALALAAGLALSPIVWLHYFVLLLVPIALARRTFGAIWLVPALLWLTPYEENLEAHWRIAVGIGVAALALAAAARARGQVARAHSVRTSYDPAP